MSAAKVKVQAIFEVEVPEAKCRCGARGIPRVTRAGLHQDDLSWGNPDGWDTVRFNGMFIDLCPSCASKVGQAIAEALS